MALSWNEWRPEPKLLSLLETLGRNQGENETIVCHICEDVFFDNKVLFSHFQTHFDEDGTLKPGLSYMSPREEINFNLNSPPHVSRSLSVPLNVGDLGTSTRQNISTNRPIRSFAGSSSQHLELPNFRATVAPLSSGISISRSALVSDFHLPMSPAASASPPIPSKFQPPRSTVASTSRSVPGTRNSVLGPTSSSVLQSARQTAVRGRLIGYTKPYILQLEQPIKKMRMSQNNGGDNNSDEMDLTLKL